MKTGIILKLERRVLEAFTNHLLFYSRYTCTSRILPLTIGTDSCMCYNSCIGWGNLLKVVLIWFWLIDWRNRSNLFRTNSNTPLLRTNISLDHYTCRLGHSSQYLHSVSLLTLYPVLLLLYRGMLLLLLLFTFHLFNIVFIRMLLEDVSLYLSQKQSKGPPNLKEGNFPNNSL